MSSTNIYSKFCTKCGIEQHLTNFSKFKHSKDGLKPICKSCTKISSKEYYVRNRSNLLSKHKEYYQTNKDEIKSNVNEYRATNIEEVKQRKLGENQTKILSMHQTPSAEQQNYKPHQIGMSMKLAKQYMQKPNDSRLKLACSMR